MKTTLDIADSLLARAKRHARRTGKPLRALVEEGLRLVLSDPGANAKYELPDRSAGNPDDADPLVALSWQEWRDEIYGGR